jgi:hypothetical protein
MEIKNNSIQPDKKNFNIIYTKNTEMAGLYDVNDITVSAKDEKEALSIFQSTYKDGKLRAIEITDVNSPNHFTKQDYITAHQMFDSDNAVELYREVLQSRRRK